MSETFSLFDGFSLHTLPELQHQQPSCNSAPEDRVDDDRQFRLCRSFESRLAEPSEQLWTSVLSPQSDVSTESYGNVQSIDGGSSLRNSCDSGSALIAAAASLAMRKIKTSLGRADVDACSNTSTPSEARLSGSNSQDFFSSNSNSLFSASMDFRPHETSFSDLVDYLPAPARANRGKSNVNTSDDPAATAASAHFLETVLGFQQEDRGDLMAALTMSRCNYLDLLIAYLHNRRIAAEDAAAEAAAEQQQQHSGGSGRSHTARVSGSGTNPGMPLPPLSPASPIKNVDSPPRITAGPLVKETGNAAIDNGSAQALLNLLLARSAAKQKAAAATGGSGGNGGGGGSPSGASSPRMSTPQSYGRRTSASNGLSRAGNNAQAKQQQQQQQRSASIDKSPAGLAHIRSDSARLPSFASAPSADAVNIVKRHQQHMQTSSYWQQQALLLQHGLAVASAPSMLQQPSLQQQISQFPFQQQQQQQHVGQHETLFQQQLQQLALQRDIEQQQAAMATAVFQQQLQSMGGQQQHQQHQQQLQESLSLARMVELFSSSSRIANGAASVAQQAESNSYHSLPLNIERRALSFR